MVVQCIVTITITLMLNHNCSYLVVISIILMIFNVKVRASLSLLSVMISYHIRYVMLARLLLVLNLNRKLIMLLTGWKNQRGGCVYRGDLVGSLPTIIMSILILNIFLILTNIGLLCKKLKGMSVLLILQ